MTVTTVNGSVETDFRSLDPEATLVAITYQVVCAGQPTTQENVARVSPCEEDAYAKHNASLAFDRLVAAANKKLDAMEEAGKIPPTEVAVPDYQPRQQPFSWLSHTSDGTKETPKPTVENELDHKAKVYRGLIPAFRNAGVVTIQEVPAVERLRTANNQAATLKKTPEVPMIGVLTADESVQASDRFVARAAMAVAFTILGNLVFGLFVLAIVSLTDLSTSGCNDPDWKLDSSICQVRENHMGTIICLCFAAVTFCTLVHILASKWHNDVWNARYPEEKYPNMTCWHDDWRGTLGYVALALVSTPAAAMIFGIIVAPFLLS